MPAVILLILVALTALPSMAHAASAQTEMSPGKRWVVFDAAPGEVNRLRIEVSTSSRAVRLSDPGVAISAGPGCHTDAAGRVVCQLDERILLVQADLEDGADRADVFTSNTGAAQVNVRGGAGDDLGRARGPSRINFAGNEGDDQLAGGHGPDVLRGQDGDDFLSGGPGGGDLLIGDAGDDVLRAHRGRDRLFGGPGADKLDARDTPPFTDSVIHCGAGMDLSILDRVDRPKMRQCETLRFAP